MKNKEKYTIDIKNLSIGTHKFSFIVDNDFFNDYKNIDIKTGKIDIDIDLEKKNNALLLNIYIKGYVNVQCDRCLDDFEMNISYKTLLIVNFGRKDSELSDADKKITISNNTNNLILDKHFYDYINLNIPYKKIHTTDNNGVSNCNKEMINTIEKYSYDNKKNKIDPRWDKLKKLLN